MIGYALGLLVGAAGIVLAARQRRKQLFLRLDQLITSEEARLAQMSSTSKEAAELRGRLSLLRQARAGRTPMDPRQRMRVVTSAVPVLALLVLLVVVWLDNNKSTSSYSLFGLGIGALGAQLVLRIRTIVWRAQQDQGVDA